MDEIIEILPFEGEKVSFMKNKLRNSRVMCKKCTHVEYEHDDITTEIPYKGYLAVFKEVILKCPLCGDTTVPFEQGVFNKGRFDWATRSIDSKIKAEQDQIDKEDRKKFLTRLCYGFILVSLLILGVYLL